MSQQKKKAARRHRRTKEAEGAPTLFTAAKCVLWALPLTVTAGLLLLFATTALLLCTGDPNRYHTAAALAVLYLTALLGGLIATRLYHRRAPLLCGAGEGILLLIFFTLAGLFLPREWGNPMGTGLSLLLRLLILPAAMLGALTGAKEKKQKRRKH